MKKVIILTMLLCLVYGNAEALDIDRYRQLPSNITAIDVKDIESMERSGWTVASAPTVVSSVYGSALDFDGTDDKFTYLTTSQSINSVVLLVNPDTTTEQFLDFDGGSHYIDVASGTVRGQGFTSPTIYVDGSASSTLTADIWHWVAVTTATGFTMSSLKLATDNSNFGNCSIKYVLTFNRVLSAQEIADIYNGTTFDYWQELVLSSDLSEINPQDLWGSNSGTGTGLVASTDIVYEYGDWAIETNGTDEKVDFSDINTIRTIELWVNPATTTEELVLIDTGKDIMVSGGTVTYTGVTATATYVNGVATTTMVANKRQHLVCVLNADIDANNFELANDGTNFGAGKFYDVRTYNSILQQQEVEDLYIRTK